MNLGPSQKIVGQIWGVFIFWGYPGLGKLKYNPNEKKFHLWAGLVKSIDQLRGATTYLSLGVPQHPTVSRWARQGTINIDW